MTKTICSKGRGKIKEMKKVCKVPCENPLQIAMIATSKKTILENYKNSPVSL